MQTKGYTGQIDSTQTAASRSDGLATNASRWGTTPRVALNAWSSEPRSAPGRRGHGPDRQWRIPAPAASAPVAAQPAAAPVLDAPPASTSSAGRSVVVAIPRDDDYLTSTTIPVAGLAFGGRIPRISVVHVVLTPTAA